MTAAHSVQSWLTTHWPWLAIGASLAMLATAHGFERFAGLYPCPLCLRQREVYWGAIAIGAVGLVALRLWPRPGLRRTLGVFLGMAFLTGAIVAGYHVAVEQGWVPARCESFGVPTDLLLLGDSTDPISAARCDAIPWQLLGVSMAGYNALASLALAAASFLAASQTPVAMRSL